MQQCLGKESALGAGGRVERVALIKSLIYARYKERACQVQLKMSAAIITGNMLITLIF